VTKIMEMARFAKSERDRECAAYDAEMVDKAISRVFVAAERRFGLAPDRASIPNANCYAGQVIYEDLALSFREGEGIHSFGVKTTCSHCGKEQEKDVCTLADIAKAVENTGECAECRVRVEAMPLETWDNLQEWQKEQAVRLYEAVREIAGEVG